MSFEPDYKVIKLDIKDFYMSGTHESLVANSSLSVDPKVRGNFYEIATLVLSSQYLQVPSSDTKFKQYQVTRGGGMGMICVGEICDADMLKAEKETVLQESFRQKFELRLYVRFKDDILMIIRGDTDDRQLALEHLRNHGKNYILEVESVTTLSAAVENDLSVPYLDIDLVPIQRSDGMVCFNVRPYKKPTSLWTPLSHSSAHNPSVHRAWPAAYINRLRSHSTNPTDAYDFSEKFLHQLRVACPGHPGIHRPKDTRKTVKQPTPTNYLVLPYRTTWSGSGIDTVLKKFDSILAKKGLPIVRCSWSLGGQHLSKLAKSTNKSKLAKNEE